MFPLESKMTTVDEASDQLPQTTQLQENTSDFSTAPWPLWLRIVFRFVFSWIASYNLPFPLDIRAAGDFGLFPGAQFLSSKYTRMWHTLVPWVGAHVLHLSKPITYFPTGSGDTTSSYVKLLCITVFAVVAMLVWTFLDRRRKEYRVLHEGLRVYVRYALAFTMFGYGFAKLPNGQFMSPDLDRLIEPYGSFTPMGTLWYFMGVSWVYTLFGGIAEVTGGFLLLFRRTTMLGALTVFAVMLNVVMLNYSYDVSVKLYSTALLLMAVFLFVPDLRRLVRFFVLDRPTTSSVVAFPWRARWVRPTRIVVKTLIIGMVVYGNVVPNVRRMHRIASMTAEMKSPLYGIYNVEGVGRDAPGDGFSELTAANWRKVAFANKYGSMLAVVMADDSMPRYNTKFDTTKHTIHLTTYTTRTPIGVLTYSRPDADHLILHGTFNGKPVDLHLRKMETSKYRLFSTGFHWTNEYSNNR